MLPSHDVGDGSGSTLPSYEDLHNFVTGGPRVAIELRRLHWSLNGPLKTAISVMEHTYYDAAAKLEPYFNTDTQEWHPISKAPMSEPRISSVKVRIDPLHKYESDWAELHRDHSIPQSCDPSYARWGTLSGRDSPDHGRLYMLKCCGEERPPVFSEVLVKARGGFVTVHDFVSQLHSWLMDRREHILGALSSINVDPLPAETELVIVPHVSGVNAGSKREWMFAKKRQPPNLSALAPFDSFAPEVIEAKEKRIRAILKRQREGGGR